MSGDMLVAAEIRRVVYDFMASVHPGILPAELAPSAPDQDPHRLIPVSDIAPMVGQLTTIRSRPPIEWLLGEFMFNNASELLIMRVLNSADIAEALEVYRQYQRIVSSFLTITHEPQRNGDLRIVLSVDARSHPVASFFLRTSASTYLHYLATHCPQIGDVRGVADASDTYDELIRRGSRELKFINLSLTAGTFRLDVSPRVLEHRFPKRDSRLLMALDLELRRKANEVPDRTKLGDRIKYHLRTHQILDATPERICADFRIDRRALTRQLQSEGTTFTNILRDLRREKATFLVRDTDLPLKRVAAELGFNSDASFSMAFKTWTGMTPMAFRRAASENATLVHVPLDWTI